MNRLLELLHQAVNTFIHNPNQFASGGLLLMAVGAVGASLRKIPNAAWDWIVHQTTVTLRITDDQRAFYWLKSWIETQPMMRRVRHIDIINHGSEKYAALPAPGHHWMLYRKRIISVTFTRTEEKKLGQTTRSETVVLKTIGRKQDVFRNIMAEVHGQFIKQEEKRPELHAWGQWGEWRQIHAYAPRPIESVIMPLDDKERLIKDIETFRDSRAWYTEMGIPYRKGYLFYGPPGTGKTSLVTGLSSYFKSNIYMLKLSDMSDTSLREAIVEVESNSFFVIEDVDCIHASHKRAKAATKEGDKKSSGVTLSGLLNVIDGLFSPPGAIFVMTTNHKEKLDPALIRPGRVDLQLCISYATPDQKKALYRRFFAAGECPQEYLDKRMTMAELQQALMEEKADAK
jgi:mitochondrial chaperone BCS1